MLLLLALLAGPDSLYARAESLLANHHLKEARQVAEDLVRMHPDDERAHLLLGRIFLIWPITGRNEAIQEFLTAKRLAPNDPEPSYLESSAWLALHTMDGDAMA